VIAVKVRHFLFKTPGVGFFIPIGDFKQLPGGFEGVLVDHAVNEIHKIFFGLLIHGPDLTEIQHADDLVGQDKNVAGMGVRMEKPVIKNLPQQNIGPAAGNS